MAECFSVLSDEECSNWRRGHRDVRGLKEPFHRLSVNARWFERGEIRRISRSARFEIEQVTLHVVTPRSRRVIGGDHSMAGYDDRPRLA